MQEIQKKLKEDNITLYYKKGVNVKGKHKNIETVTPREHEEIFDLIVKGFDLEKQDRSNQAWLKADQTKRFWAIAKLGKEVFGTKFETIIAVASYYPNRSPGFENIFGVYTDKQFRGKYIASALLSLIKENNPKQNLVLSFLPDDATLQFYKRNGFVEEVRDPGVREAGKYVYRGYYPSPTKPSIPVAKREQPSPPNTEKGMCWCLEVTYVYAEIVAVSVAGGLDESESESDENTIIA